MPFSHELSARRKVPLPDSVRPKFGHFNNAALVKPGIADTNRIDLERVKQRTSAALA